MSVHVTLGLGAGGPVAIKTATGPASVDRLRDEVQRLHRAGHPGVVTVVGAGFVGEAFELRTRYVGDTLAQWTGSLPHAAGLCAAIGTTVADLHEIGLVHGRLDPTHVLVGADGRPRLCGLSHPGESGPADDVHAIGQLLEHLLARVGTERRSGLGRPRSAGAGPRRALSQIAARALDPVAARRPSARALARSILAAAPGAELPPPSVPTSVSDGADGLGAWLGRATGGPPVSGGRPSAAVEAGAVGQPPGRRRPSIGEAAVLGPFLGPDDADRGVAGRGAEIAPVGADNGVGAGGARPGAASSDPAHASPSDGPGAPPARTAVAAGRAHDDDVWAEIAMPPAVVSASAAGSMASGAQPSAADPPADVPAPADPGAVPGVPTAPGGSPGADTPSADDAPPAPDAAVPPDPTATARTSDERQAGDTPDPTAVGRTGDARRAPTARQAGDTPDTTGPEHVTGTRHTGEPRPGEAVGSGGTSGAAYAGRAGDAGDASDATGPERAIRTWTAGSAPDPTATGRTGNARRAPHTPPFGEASDADGPERATGARKGRGGPNPAEAGRGGAGSAGGVGRDGGGRRGGGRNATNEGDTATAAASGAESDPVSGGPAAEPSLHQLHGLSWLDDGRGDLPPVTAPVRTLTRPSPLPRLGELRFRTSAAGDDDGRRRPSRRGRAGRRDRARGGDGRRGQSRRAGPALPEGRPGQAPPVTARRDGRRDARRASALRVGSACVVGLTLVAGGTLATRGASSDEPSPSPAAAGPALPAGCRIPSRPAADVDGDGCPEPVRVEGRVVEAGGRRWSLGEPGDVAAVGDWDCDGSASPALLRPGTGDVFVFPRWASAGEPLTVDATDTVRGGTALRARRGSDGCDTLVVERTAGEVTLEVDR